MVGSGLTLNQVHLLYHVAVKYPISNESSFVVLGIHANIYLLISTFEMDHYVSVSPEVLVGREL